MHKSVQILYLSLLVFILLNNRAEAQDTLYMYNGNRLVGKVTKIDLAIITFKINDVSTVTLQLEKVKTLSIFSKLLKIETMFKQTHIGHIEADSHDGIAKIITATDTTNLYLNTILSVTAFGETFWERLNVHLGAGYSYTKSSDIGRLNFDGRITHTRERVETILSASAIMTQENGDVTRDRENLTAQGNYFYNPMWFNQLILNYQRNLELGIAQRIQQGVGLGNRFLALSNMQAKIYVGYVVNKEYSTEGKTSGSLFEAPVSFQYNFYSFSKPKLTISTSQTFYFGINQNGRLRQDGDTKISWKFWSDFSLAFNFYNNYDSQPPGQTKASSDYGVVFNIAYDF